MSNGVLGISWRSLFRDSGGKGPKAGSRRVAVEKDEITTLQEEAIFKAHLSNVYQPFCGTSRGGWGQPW